MNHNTLLKEGLRDLGAMVLSRLVLARGSSGRFLLAVCSFGWRVKSNLSRLVGSFRLRCAVWRVYPPSAALVHPCHYPTSAEDKRSWKSPFQSWFSATIPSTLLWLLEGQTISCLRGNKREAQRGHLSSSQGISAGISRLLALAQSQLLRVSNSLLCNDVPSRERLTRSVHEVAALPYHKQVLYKVRVMLGSPEKAVLLSDTHLATAIALGATPGPKEHFGSRLPLSVIYLPNGWQGDKGIIMGLEKIHRPPGSLSMIRSYSAKNIFIAQLAKRL